jgi:hypothetical protein
MPTKRTPVEPGPSTHAELPAHAPARVRVDGYTLLVDRSRKRPPIGRLRKDLARVGVDPALVDADFLRKLDRATDALLERAFEDDSVLDVLGRDPVRAYRSVDKDVAATLAEITAAARAASIPPPDLGPLPANRRPPPAVRPHVRSVTLDAAVREHLLQVMQWAAEDPDHLARLGADPAAALDEVVPDLSPAVRRRLEHQLATGAGGAS